MLVSITEVIVSVISSVRKSTILFKTSGLVRATIALSVTFNLSAGVLAAGFCPVASKSVGLSDWPFIGDGCCSGRSRLGTCG